MSDNDFENGTEKILILAPAGDKASFLAAIAAGADAIYCGLKSFSARMQADNFKLDELARLVMLAHKKGIKVYVALNSLVKPDEIQKASIIVDQLATHVKPDALIVQDLAFVEIAHQTGYEGDLHLSTLANASFPQSLKIAEDLGMNRVVVPRELNVDEIKKMAASCSENMNLEVFVHGALCYGVSGRCYWSSYLGGKSGLRGRCVQPCRRIYSQKEQNKRFFSCSDLSVDVLVKVLKTVPQINTWKIEGRKKGPHYVYYTVKAYQMLRDSGTDPEIKKIAIAFLEQALSRVTTHYNFLPQRPQIPTNIKNQTGSGFFLGKVRGAGKSPYLIPREGLIQNDLLRIGYEDEFGHTLQRINISVPKKGRLYLKQKSKRIINGSPVFLIDRKEKKLEELLAGLEKELNELPLSRIPLSSFKLSGDQGNTKRNAGRKKHHSGDLFVGRNAKNINNKGLTGIWLGKRAVSEISKGAVRNVWWWLPPVIWPESESSFIYYVSTVLKKGALNFVLNAPWQMAFFKHLKPRDLVKLNIWAGPFCNIANGLSISQLSKIGCSGVILSPELSGDDYLKMPKQSELPLGIVVSGNWPLCVSRTLSEDISRKLPFFSPKGESAWISKFDSDNWIFPNWEMDITDKKKELQKKGVSLFVHLTEQIPRNVKMKKRPGLWNWTHGLK